MQWCPGFDRGLSVTFLVGKKRSDLGNQTSVLMHFFVYLTSKITT